MADDDSELELDAVFTEPPRLPTPPSTSAIYTREADDTKTSNTNWIKITIGLVGTHPLWGHYLWNAARAFATYLDQNTYIYRDRYVLELGAGGGLPGIVTALNGAQKVVLTDYPDSELLANVEHNIEVNIPDTLRDRVKVEGHIWGHHVQPLLEHLPGTHGISKTGFHLIILSDLIFNHSQHEALLNTCERALAPQTSDSTNHPCVLVFYSHHRPHLAHRDMHFFQFAEQKGWICEQIMQRKFPPMFPKDSGDEEMRSTVYGWRMTRTATDSSKSCIT